MPGEEGGTIDEIHDDYIEFSIAPDDEHTEKIEIPIPSIMMISEGKQKRQKTLPRTKEVEPQ